MTREEKNEEKQKEIFREEKKEKTKKTIKITIKIIIALILFSLIFYSYTTYISTIKIKVREYRVINHKIPENFNGLKIIQFSDLHFGSTMNNENIEEIVQLSNERKPDIIVFTGDFLNKTYKMSSKEQELLINNLKNMTATLGKYAILGDEDTEKVSTIFNQSEFTILRNEYDLIYQNSNNPILLVGLNSSKNEQNIENAFSYYKEENHNANIFTITLLHEPDSIDEIIPYYNVDLALAGHSHNGNIRIPIINRSFSKIDGAKKYDQDYYKINNTELYISSGLGTKNGIRLFCRPSINFFRISNS